MRASFAPRLTTTPMLEAERKASPFCTGPEIVVNGRISDRPGEGPGQSGPLADASPGSASADEAEGCSGGCVVARGLCMPLAAYAASRGLLISSLEGRQRARCDDAKKPEERLQEAPRTRPQRGLGALVKAAAGQCDFQTHCPHGTLAKSWTGRARSSAGAARAADRRRARSSPGRTRRSISWFWSFCPRSIWRGVRSGSPRRISCPTSNSLRRSNWPSCEVWTCISFCPRITTIAWLPGPPRPIFGPCCSQGVISGAARRRSTIPN